MCISFFSFRAFLYLCAFVFFFTRLLLFFRFFLLSFLFSMRRDVLFQYFVSSSQACKHNSYIQCVIFSQPYNNRVFFFQYNQNRCRKIQKSITSFLNPLIGSLGILWYCVVINGSLAASNETRNFIQFQAKKICIIYVLVFMRVVRRLDQVIWPSVSVSVFLELPCTKRFTHIHERQSV